MPLNDKDYFNVMPCALPSEGVLGLKVVTRNENRRLRSQSNIDRDILLYSYKDFLPIALIDGAYITTIRTAAVVVHFMLNFTRNRETLSMIGLGNIGIEIGNILFELLTDDKIKVKLFRYKDHAQKFFERFSKYKNIQFTICNTYDELMSDRDVVFSSVTYEENDFCNANIFKQNCNVIPVHLRGFKECDIKFDTVIKSDLVSIQKFTNYNKMSNLQYIDKLIDNEYTMRLGRGRTIIYNLGLAVYDIYFQMKYVKE